MQILDRRQALAIAPLWRLGFRPFFLAGALYAALAIPLWIAAWTGLWPGWQPAGGWLAWHRHEMLFGFALAIVAGFLLTAGQTWTGQPAPTGRPLMALALLWLAARLAWLVGAPLPVLTLLELAFPLLLALTLGRMVWRVRQVRNYPVVAVLLLLSAADAQSLVGLWRDDLAWQRQGALAGIWLVAALMLMIGGRVIPFFTQRGLGREKMVQPWPWLEIVLLVGAALIAGLHAAGTALSPQPLLALPCLLLAVGQALRSWRWHDAGIWRVPLLWSLHVAMLWLVLALLWLGLWHLGLVASYSAALHALTVGAMGGLILAMIARVSLGHTGRPLVLPAGMLAAFVLLNLASLLRLLATELAPLSNLRLAALCWLLAFGLFVWRYAAILLGPRADGHPG